MSWAGPACLILAHPHAASQHPSRQDKRQSPEEHVKPWHPLRLPACTPTPTWCLVCVPVTIRRQPNFIQSTYRRRGCACVQRMSATSTPLHISAPKQVLPHRASTPYGTYLQTRHATRKARKLKQVREQVWTRELKQKQAQRWYTQQRLHRTNKYNPVFIYIFFLR